MYLYAIDYCHYKTVSVDQMQVLIFFQQLAVLISLCTTANKMKRNASTE